MSEIINVLVIEDNTIDRIIAERILQKESYFKLTHAGSITQAFEILASENFDVILLDLNLPDSWGLETFDKIHEKRKEIPIVVLSGSDDKYTTMEILRRGGQDVINKKHIIRHSLVDSIIFSIERNKSVIKEIECAKRFIF